MVNQKSLREALRSAICSLEHNISGGLPSKPLWRLKPSLGFVAPLCTCLSLPFQIYILSNKVFSHFYWLVIYQISFSSRFISAYEIRARDTEARVTSGGQTPLVNHVRLRQRPSWANLVSSTSATAQIHVWAEQVNSEERGWINQQNRRRLNSRLR